jgi:hypothetical protein
MAAVGELLGRRAVIIAEELVGAVDEVNFHGRDSNAGACGAACYYRIRPKVFGRIKQTMATCTVCESTGLLRCEQAEGFIEKDLECIDPGDPWTSLYKCRTCSSFGSKSMWVEAALILGC